MTCERNNQINRFLLVLLSAMVLLLSACGGLGNPNSKYLLGINGIRHLFPALAVKDKSAKLGDKISMELLNPDEDQTSFSVKGTWAGTLTLGDGSTRTIRFAFDNNGIGKDGLAGTMTIEGLPKLLFKNGRISRPSQLAFIDLSDSDGYLYNVDGNFTEKRVDDGSIKFSNPNLIRENRSRIDVVLVKQ